ncbi:hypothetical protein I2I11_17670 [Pontibacter sp. 172403-2]|uniref:hypothetical protein n=1 Tax=Pontibacter rufus TaxID=2791028 RepID=UPI0018AF5668|nr:hypothetical protein [Pontibacter sp. 172403-2]MBF9255132.1 hypothetical protein [Pontibacter sp. 172403-2]
MKVETFHIAAWGEPETGLVIDENDEWVLVKYIPVDYQIDGYKIYKKIFIEERKHSSKEAAIDKEAAIEKVLQLKEVKAEYPEGFNFGSNINLFGSTVHLLRWSEQKYGLFEFQDNNEAEVFYGKISEVTDSLLRIDMVKSDGSVEKKYDYEFEVDEIRAIAFESDYFLSMKLLWQDKMKNNSLQQNL